MFTIVGSGFGLYGYLPALIECFGEPVVLPLGYREKIAARPELAGYLAQVRWVPDPESALAAATGVVIANAPLVQPEVVARCLELSAMKVLVLEKPLAATPELAGRLLEDLKRSGKRFRIGYTLLDTVWGHGFLLPRSAEGNGKVTITWTFMAHHFSKSLQNWKRDHAQGGGVLRFFGIHLVALLARHGYRDVELSMLHGENANQPERWTAEFSGADLPVCRVAVDSRSATDCFRIVLNVDSGSTSPVELREPFALEASEPPGADRRVRVLKHLLDTFQESDEEYLAFYGEVNRLWQRVEAVSTFSVK